MAWDDIHVNDYGWVGKLRAVQDETAVDISSYTTLQMIFRKPNGSTLPAKTASFTTDGTDGYIQYQILTGEIDTVGRWAVEMRIAKTGVQLTGGPLYFNVQDRL